VAKFTCTNIRECVHLPKISTWGSCVKIHVAWMNFFLFDFEEKRESDSVSHFCIKFRNQEIERMWGRKEREFNPKMGLAWATPTPKRKKKRDFVPIKHGNLRGRGAWNTENNLSLSLAPTRATPTGVFFFTEMCWGPLDNSSCGPQHISVKKNTPVGVARVCVFDLPKKKEEKNVFSPTAIPF